VAWLGHTSVIELPTHNKPFAWVCQFGGWTIAPEIFSPHLLDLISKIAGGVGQE
jgi:hypothetical protein